jgi:diguanylate cyclase (GGDEF)-like protein
MRILIADDDPIWRRMIESMLAQLGEEVVAASDGTQAWEILQKEDRPSLAILDWMMPGMDGVEICRRLRASSDGPYVYILLLTVKDHRTDIIQGFEAGADDYIRKPFDPDELRARLRAAARVMNLQQALLTAQRELQVQATRDSLTGLWNRRAILEILDRELARCRREGTPAGVLLADVDHFKGINDNYGHGGGDAVLRQLSERMQASVRSYDSVGRYGGEEMLFVLPSCDAESALRSAERIRLGANSSPCLVDSVGVTATLSIGVVSTSQHDSAGAADLIQAADAALYRAKRRGRNRVELADPAELPDTTSTPGEAANPHGSAAAPEGS